MAFGKFIAPAVVEGLVEHPERLVLGGETRELTVLFSDLRDFSSISEGLSAQELTHFMNAYLTPMTDAILDREGTVDKYIGDAIVAFWNAPLDIADHPRKAVGAALAMRAALLRFNAERAAVAAREDRAYRRAAMGIGINLGPCSVGNMGSARRFDYSILGDVVNFTSRLEGLCKWFRVDILVSGDLRDVAAEFAWLDLGAALVVGRSTPTRIFALAGDASFAASEAFATWRDEHVTMMRYHAEGDFTRARAAAARLRATVEPDWSGCYMAMEQRFRGFRGGSALHGGRRARLEDGQQMTGATMEGANEARRLRYWRRIEQAHEPGAYQALDAAYRQPHRAYHSWAHIDELLAGLEHFDRLATRPDLIAAAIFWHDAVHLARDPDGKTRLDRQNVGDSVAAFHRHTLLEGNEAKAVEELVMATADHVGARASCELYPGFSDDLDLFVDLDLSPLAAPWDIFAANTQKNSLGVGRRRRGRIRRQSGQDAGRARERRGRGVSSRGDARGMGRHRARQSRALHSGAARRRALTRAATVIRRRPVATARPRRRRDERGNAPPRRKSSAALRAASRNAARRRVAARDNIGERRLRAEAEGPGLDQPLHRLQPAFQRPMMDPVRRRRNRPVRAARANSRARGDC